MANAANAADYTPLNIPESTKKKLIEIGNTLMLSSLNIPSGYDDEQFTRERLDELFKNTDKQDGLFQLVNLVDVIDPAIFLPEYLLSRRNPMNAATLGHSVIGLVNNGVSNAHLRIINQLRGHKPMQPSETGKKTMTKTRTKAKAGNQATAPNVADGEKYVVVTTEHRGVFFGKIETKDEWERTIAVKEIRNCIYWGKSCGGFLGLAGAGPDKECRIGMEAPRMVLHDITGVIDCSPESVTAWKAAGWA